ncbi:succinate dehydrogenase/Fumarate reductase transmembrane subunit domain-containing protein [Sarocladium implicatum]|nr:succinate dehydrogenase/Fumarate reductase transmembrane subunit domain-containing protein [Sarocladium implicatum]
MLVSRIGGMAVRRGALAPSRISTSASLTSVVKLRYINSSSNDRATALPKATKLSVSEGNDILDKQRLNRPIAPHLEVYRLSQTYLGSSAWMRITGSGILGVGYLYFSAYLLAPLFRYDVGSENLVSAFSQLPGAVKTGVKMALAWPFAFHFCNGIKQLLYDSGWAYPYNKVTMSRNDVYIFTISTAVALGITFGL